MNEDKLRHRFLSSVVVLRSFARRVGNGRFKLENDGSQEILKEVSDALAFLDSYHEQAEDVARKASKSALANVNPIRFELS
jgi:hypothetical protein